MKKYSTLILLLQLIVLAGCSIQTSKDETISVVDMVGDTVIVPKNPQKVAVVSRAAADMMVAFGLGGKIDGIYYSVLDNPWTSYLYPNSNDYYRYEYQESYELFYARGIDLIFAPEKYIAEDLRDHGLNAITVSQYGTPSFDEHVFTLANLISTIWDDELVKIKVNKWKTDFTAVKEEIQSKLTNVENGHKSIYYVRGDKNKSINYTDTGFSLQETFAKYLKLDYVGKQFTTNSPSAEEVLAMNPDIFIIGGIYQNVLIDEIKSQEPWVNLSAVEKNQIFNIGIGFVMFEQTSVEQTIFLAQLANNVYPDIFNFNIQEMVKETIEYYFDVNLTYQQITAMLTGHDIDGNSLIPTK